MASSEAVKHMPTLPMVEVAAAGAPWGRGCTEYYNARCKASSSERPNDMRLTMYRRKGELFVWVEATSINPLDWKFQKGVRRPFLPNKFPFIPRLRAR
jgi:hypothetical protein